MRERLCRTHQRDTTDEPAKKSDESAGNLDFPFRIVREVPDLCAKKSDLGCGFSWIMQTNGGFQKKYWKERPFLRYQHSFRNATRGAKILVICFYLATAFFLLESLD